MSSGYSDFVRRLHDDRAFRHEFAANPAKMLKAAGLDPSLMDLPDQIDADALDRHIAARANKPAPDGTEMAQLSAQALWEKFNFIRLKDLFGTGPAGAAIGVIYGTTATTSTTVALTVQGALANPEVEIARLSTLRTLSQLSAGALRFSVRGPDGRKVADLNTDLMRAFLAKAQ